MRDKKLGRVGNIFKMKEIINGPKKGGQEPTAVRHPTSGDMVMSTEEIKRVTLLYCFKNLENSSAVPEVEKDSNLKKYLHNIRMEDQGSDGFEIVKDDFDNVLKKFGSKTTKSYDFLLKGGPKYKEVIYKLCKSMIEKEEFPTSFRKTILNMIWKQKGPSEILKNNRFIHTKETFLPRICEALATNKMKECILSSLFHKTKISDGNSFFFFYICKNAKKQSQGLNAEVQTVV